MALPLEPPRRKQTPYTYKPLGAIIQSTAIKPRKKVLRERNNFLKSLLKYIEDKRNWELMVLFW